MLRTLGDRCAALWNSAQYRMRQAFFSGLPVPSYARLCKEFQDHDAYRALPSDMAQEILKKARQSWNAFFACLRLYRDGRLDSRPRVAGYWKDRRSGQRLLRVIPVKSPRSYSLTANTLSVTLPADLRSGGRLAIPTRGILRFSGAPRTLELSYDPARRRWYASQVVEMPEPERNPRPTQAAGIDLGARTLVALAVEGVERQVLFSGREVWKDFLYWTRKISAEQSRLAGAGRRTSWRLKLLYRRRARRLAHAFRALAKELARTLRASRVGTLYLEDLTGIRKDMDFGPGNLLVHNFWAFRMLRKAVEAACLRAGIEVVPVEADGTSSRCSACSGAVQRPKRNRAYCPRCGLAWHADANAALNIMSKGSSKGHGAKAKAPAPAALRWNRHRWVARAKPAAGMSRKTASRNLAA